MINKQLVLPRQFGCGYGRRQFQIPGKQLTRIKIQRTGQRKFRNDATTEEWQKTIKSIKSTHSSSQSEQKQISDEADKRMKTIIKTIEESYSSSQNGSQLGYFSTDEFQQLRTKIQRAIGTMSYGLVERDTEVRLLLLAALSGEHALFIGPPGTAKSELGRRLSNLCDGTYFERLLTRFSVPEELFGPLSMRALEEDKYFRQTKGYLPKANVAFIDEIFKANSAILNTLLTLLNERLFDNGQNRENVPLVCLVGASNELPESEELDALYDRFLVRKQVKQVSAGGLSDLLQDDEVVSQGLAFDDEPEEEEEDNENSSALLNLDSFITCRQNALKQVTVPISIVEIIVSLRSWLQEKCEPPIYVSDRRLVKALGLLKVAAFTNGRQEVNMLDITLLSHVLWQRPDEYQKINDKILEYIGSGDINVGNFDFILEGIYGRALTMVNQPTSETRDYSSLMNEIGDLKKMLIDSMQIIWGQIQQEETQQVQHLWIASDDTRMMSTMLSPKFKDAINQHEKTLKNCLKLEHAMEKDSEAITMAQLLPEHWQSFIKNSAPKGQKKK